MMVKFHKRGCGRGSGPIDYLLGRQRDRAGATLMRGDHEAMVELIDSLHFKNKYTSGLLSFTESDIDVNLKDQIIDAFEKTLFPGMESDQYNIVWIEHRDKSHLELNFVVANVENRTGKSLTPYLKKIDHSRISAFKNWVNAKYDFSDPNDPANARRLRRRDDLPQDVERLRQKLHAHVEACIAAGEIETRDDIVKELERLGINVARTTKSSISIRTNTSKRNIRLTGAVYLESWNGQLTESEIAKQSLIFASQRIDREKTAAAQLKVAFERKKILNEKRYACSVNSEPASPIKIHKPLTTSTEALNGRSRIGIIGRITRQLTLRIQNLTNSLRCYARSIDLLRFWDQRKSVQTNTVHAIRRNEVSMRRLQQSSFEMRTLQSTLDDRKVDSSGILPGNAPNH
ncbi:MAG: relaxase/mobilization nuclease domain-containing protein [Pseudomonadota bacterium]